MVWAGVVIIIAGTVIGAVATVLLKHFAWLWIPAAVVVIAGVVVVAVGRPSSTSRAGRPSR